MKNCIYADELDEHSAELIARASSLHDIGKGSIPDSILTKPGPLTYEEMEIMKTHSEIGSRFIDSLADHDDELFVRFARQIHVYLKKTKSISRSFCSMN